MADRSKAFEITIAALGVIVTAILGYGQYRLGIQQAQASKLQQQAETRRAVDSVEVQVMGLVAPHLANLAKPGPDFSASERIVIAASEYLSNQYSRTSLATMAARISEGNASASLQSTARLQEATAPSTPGTKWYAVLVTLPPDNESQAKREANAWLDRVSAKMPGTRVDLYKTKVSNNFAVVLGGPVGQADAVSIARRAREAGLAADSFAQKDREWTLVGAAPFSK